MAKHTSTTYGNLVRIDPESGAAPEVLHRVPLGASTAEGGLAESDIHDLLFRFPDALPIASIDASYANAVAVCRELYTRAGYVDALYINALGRLTLAEFKLWRNPQARREVIGQILDYAKELASWSYADLQREVSRALGRTGNVLYELVSGIDPGTNEADFVDNVTRHLQRGEFLLLIVGDGIREDVEDIVGFVQSHSGLHFNLALVEAALYREGASRLIVQPRVLARTEIVQRIVVENRGDDDIPSDIEPLDETPSHQATENLRFWSAVLDYQFLDTEVDMPKPARRSWIAVPVRNSSFHDQGLSFCAFVERKECRIGCFLTCRESIAPAKRIFDAIKQSIDEYRRELRYAVEFWSDRDGPRIGFRRETTFPLPANAESDDFRAAVAWMHERLDLLVSTLHHRLRRMIDGGT